MFRDMTLGQYYPAESVIHKLDPRVKLVATFVYILSLFFIGSVTGYLLAALFLLSVIALSRVPIGFMVRGLRAIVILMVVAALFNVFLTPGEVIFSWRMFSVTKEGCFIAAKMVVRLTLLIMGSSVMTLTTTPANLTDGLEKLLGPLRKIRVPVHEMAMMMSIALRFIPILVEETDRIMKAQIARGADFESGNLIRRAKSLIPLLIPLFVSAFRRANDLAMAMEARCYRGGAGRTKMKPLVYSRRDRIAYLILALYPALLVAIGYFHFR
ncbi:MAG: energy-coupling factor transporter transmembrane protein EcfT [Lachnospiraceae bacterium]|nr:energy-coupling factor transporter transmembrane protein EcfT [Lachnospiraceae bacterium]